MSDATDLIDMGYGGPDGLDRFMDEVQSCSKRCMYWDEIIAKDGDCDACIEFWEGDE